MPFTPEQARIAAQRSAEVRRANRERRELLAAQGAIEEASSVGRGDAQDGMGSLGVGSSATADRVVLVRVPVPIGEIIRKLSKEAATGDSGSSRELRAWLSQFPPDADAADASDLDTVTRAQVAAVLARAIAAAEQPLQTDGFEARTQDAFDSDLESNPEPATGHPREKESHPIAEGEGPSQRYTPPNTHTPPAKANGSHAPDGTGREPLTRSASTDSQMTVDECIEVAERGSDLAPSRSTEGVTK